MDPQQILQFPLPGGVVLYQQDAVIRKGVAK